MIQRIKINFNQRGDMNAIGTLFIIFVMVIFIFVGIDVYGYMSTKNKLTQAAQETLEIMKSDGGFDYDTREFFYDYARKRGLDLTTITVVGTPKLVQRGNSIELKTSSIYVLKALKPLGLGELKWDVNVSVDGLARTYFREG